MPLDKVLGFFADNKEVTQLIAKSVPAIMGFHQANKSKNAIEDYQTKLDDIEKSRQQIVNPYANVTNPFANMQVATKAAEMQAEQADISLANTLDNLRQTGAGGATALAQAALRSKQGISANIQQQEAQNQRLQAQGQQRMEMAKAQGEQAKFNMQENRDFRDTNRLQMQMDLAQQQRATGLATGTAALASGIGGLSGFINPEAKNTENAFNTDGSVAGIDYSNSQSLNAVNPFSQSLPNYSNVQTGNQANSVVQVNQNQNTSAIPFGISNIPAGLPAGFDMNTRLLDPNDEAAFGLTWDATQNKYI
tara:strand:- start:4940 stop:5860 length:921 start_codon:yes stop_codon:yes gene_type:complete